MNTQDLLRLWGKTDKSNPDNYHPLLFHLLDVGHVTQRLWNQALSPRLRGQVAQALGLDAAAAARLVVLLAAQHDLGKASAFQRKDTGLWNQLCEIGLTLSVVKDRPHGYVSAKTLPMLAQQGIGGWSANAEVAQELAQITGGHHGTFPTSADLDMGSLTLGGEEWDTARADLLREVCRVFYADENLSENPILCPREALTDSCLFPLLGGLISVADWIGSSSFFPPAGPISLSSYVLLSQKRAEAALKEFGWMAAPRFAAPALFREMFPFTPNRMQQKTVEWTSAATDPYLLIIEAAMGDGKTEAALYAADQALATDQARGFYIALPTQATGNAMFRRVHTYLTDRGHSGSLNLQLVHAGAFLSEEFEDLQQAAQELKDLEDLQNAQVYDDAPEAKTLDEEGQAGRVVAESWFTARKRPLLARFGVGTIDQSLLGVLQTKHWFVRLLGLAGKVVIFDEVHAYDIYMSTLLCGLLRWLRVLDCTVILLSATLPASARQELVTAWTGEPTVIPDAEYPRLTLCAANAPPNAETVADTNPVTKTVALDWTGFDWENVWDRLHSDLPNGGGALLLCNTVTRAQDAYAYLDSRLTAEGWTVKLFHARTPAGWRQEAEKEVLATFGKTSDLDRRRLKTLLIATQIVEQSLDIDFDWIATEMAPADLLLQRMGRLWRHPHRIRAVSTARFVVLCGRTDAGFPVFPDYAELIYDRFILLRSWLALQKRGRTLILPAAIDALVQEVYDPAMPEGLSEDWPAVLTEAQDAQERQKAEDQGKADAVSLPTPDEGPESILELGSAADRIRRKLWEDDDPRVHKTVRAATRLGDPSVSVICTGTDEHGEPLAEMPTGEPNLKTIRKMLRFGLPLSRPIPLFRALIVTDPPDTWKESSLLRYHREIEFTQGRAAVGGYDLRLTRAEGLIIKKQGTGAEE